jgi:putative phosphoribosyl transferase
MFDDRSHGGRVLGDLVARCVLDSPVAVLALPRGGVPVGLEVALRLGSGGNLDVDFDVFLVRKLGVPDRPELAFGAIASGGVRVLNRFIVAELGLSEPLIEGVVQREQRELERRGRLYRRECPHLSPKDRVVVLADDGLATGATMIAAVRAARRRHARRIIVAVPVSSRSAVDDLRDEADEVIAAKTPEPFNAVGYWYRNFEQVSDEEVRELLGRFRPAATKSCDRL